MKRIRKFFFLFLASAMLLAVGAALAACNNGNGKVTLRFDVQGGDPIPSIVAEKGSEVTLPEATREGCAALSSINSDTVGEFIIPDNVTTIEESAFNGCSFLQKITLPFIGSRKGNTGRAACFGYIFGTESYQNGIKITQAYPDWAENFYLPATLRSVTITKETLIGAGAFQNCSMLDEIRINSAAQNNVGARAFSNTATPTWF